MPTSVLDNLTPSSAAPVLAMRDAAMDRSIMRTARATLNAHPDPMVKMCLAALASALDLADKHWTDLGECKPTEFDVIEVRLPGSGDRPVSIGRTLAPHEPAIDPYTHVSIGRNYDGTWMAKSPGKEHRWAFGVGGEPAVPVIGGVATGTGLTVNPGDVIEIGHTRFVLAPPAADAEETP
jgi:hypothetical protein